MIIQLNIYIHYIELVKPNEVLGYYVTEGKEQTTDKYLVKGFEVTKAEEKNIKAHFLPSHNQKLKLKISDLRTSKGSPEYIELVEGLLLFNPNELKYLEIAASTNNIHRWVAKTDLLVSTRRKVITASNNNKRTKDLDGSIKTLLKHGRKITIGPNGSILPI